MAAFVLAAMVLLWVAARNATTICVLAIERGKVVVKRGGIAPRALSDIEDVVRRPKVKAATVRIVRQRGHAAVTVKGDMPPAQEQQLRNVIGTMPLAKLINARARRR